MTHLDALNLRLSHERQRLAASRTERERQLRAVWVAGIEKEITAEHKFLGIEEASAPTMTIDDILAELDA